MYYSSTESTLSGYKVYVVQRAAIQSQPIRSVTYFRIFCSAYVLLQTNWRNPSAKMTIVATSDTRNQTWAKDTSSFGHRMLKKMGWSEGKVSNCCSILEILRFLPREPPTIKIMSSHILFFVFFASLILLQGLGRKEDGSATHLRAVRRAEDTLGIGAETDAFGSNSWDQNKHNFSQVLGKLRENHSSSIVSVQSSKSIKADAGEPSRKKRKNASSSQVIQSEQLILAQNRVTSGHAAKVRKSKDMSTKSDEDMAAIFGMSVSEFKKSHVTKTPVSSNDDKNCAIQEKEKKSKKRERESTYEVCYEKNSHQYHQVSLSSCSEKCSIKAEKKKSKKRRGVDTLVAVCS